MGNIPTEGKEGFTLVHFHAAQGWLGSGKDVTAPVEALSTFELSPDNKILEKTTDEEALKKAKEAFDVLSFCFILIFYIRVNTFRRNSDRLLFW